MNKLTGIFFALMILIPAVQAQFSTRARDSINKITAVDYQNMLQQLGIKSIRHGANGSGDKGDAWVDVRGMFLAAVGAGPVYRLLGKKDLGTEVLPPVETPLMDGDLTFRQHSAGHTPGPNWPFFIKFASRYFE